MHLVLMFLQQHWDMLSHTHSVSEEEEEEKGGERTNRDEKKVTEKAAREQCRLWVYLADS